MGKYLLTFSISLQQTLQYRTSLLIDRIRSLALILSLYFLWSALLQNQESFLSYSRAQMLSYVLGMSLLRALVFSGRTWETISDIATGKISSYLIRPIHYTAYCLAKDSAYKLISFLSAILEVALLILVLQAPLYRPHHIETALIFLLSVAGAYLLYFFLQTLVLTAAFWTAESWGPLFCFEILLQFSAGAFFPLDVLPEAVQRVLHAFPFPYLIFFPLNVYLERLSPAVMLQGLALQWMWCGIAFLLSQWAWNKGVESYCAEGG